ncbi:MAG: monovalent cation:proton antiporter-2 (CPA2) family protein [Chitinophagaceae bacterium]|nr:monovalent cation:proton antiporter-2 (CPA2) family protein [Chitinophagaceae bacterium]
MDKNSFLFQAMIYLAAAVAMVPVAKKLGLGSVLGYLIAGVLIGPAVFGFIGEEGEDVMHFAEFGVVIMLFVVGLELEPALLWRLRKPIVGLGGLQVLASAVLLAAGAMALGLPWNAALALGMTLAMSSTAIVLQTFQEKGWMKTAAGESAFAVLLFQDIAVIPMLALFPLLAVGGGTSATDSAAHHPSPIGSLPGWAQTLAVLAAVAGIVLAGRYLIKPLLRIVARTRLRELFTATSLLLVVGIAELMELVGLSPALGTFLAGVVLANSEYRHELESDIDPFKGLLLGLFFMAVGASIDFALILAQPWLILGLVLAVMTIKGLVLLALGKLFRLSTDQNAIFGSSLNQVGEFAFVLVAFSVANGIFSTPIADMAMAVVAISMAITPLVMLFNEKILLRRIGTKEAPPAGTDVHADEDNPVIIAGFGHFGSTVGRLLRAHHIGCTILDIDSDQVDRLRRMGFKVFYGDAGRHDLLEIAGAARAKVIVIAVGDAERRLEMIQTVKKHFPDLRIMVRASNRYDAYDLMNEGMLHIYRDTLDTSIRMGVDVMRMLGHRSYSANRAARTFRRYDEQKLKELAAIADEKEYVLTARKYIEEIETILRADLAERDLTQDEGWDEAGLIKEANMARQS